MVSDALVVEGHDLPGLSCGSHTGVHVGVQLRREPHEQVPADAASARWEIDMEVVDRDGDIDFRGPAVQGRRGERFVYLTWGEVGGETFEMFRRAKLMLADVPDPRCGRGGQGPPDRRGGLPRCARLRPPAVEWS